MEVADLSVCGRVVLERCYVMGRWLLVLESDDS